MRHCRLRAAPGAVQAGFDGAGLTALARAIAHRGPDGIGQSLVGRVGLVQARLAIVDLDGGDQPLFAGPAALIANGEIYNDLALRQAMPEVRFATHSDCEPPLHLWLRDGPAYVEQLRGMYAIAIHERGSHTLTLSRDPFGIKPLYVAETPGGIAFASEPQALLAAGLVERRMRGTTRDELLQLQFTTGRDTIFEGIPPGCCRARRSASPAAGSSTVSAAPPSRPVRSRPCRRPGRWRVWTGRWRTACRCTSAPMCRTACSCPAASTVPRCWR